MIRILRKFTTKPMWWLETRRSYPIRDQWALLPPIAAAQGPVVFAMLTPPRTFNDALWAAWSWMRFLGDRVRLEIYLDGVPTDEMRQAQEQVLPGSSLCNVADRIKAAGEFPANLASYIVGHNTGRKLALILALQKQGRVLFSDADVLAFAQPHEILDQWNAEDTGAYFCESAGGSFDPAVIKRGEPLGLQPLDSLNSGFLLIPQNSLPWETADKLLEGWEKTPSNWFTEQTVLACLASVVLMTALPRERYVLTNSRQFYWQKDVDYAQIASRHFTGPTRHVMYSRGLPWLLRHAVGASRG